ncbi:MAG: hypothetical protein R3F11_27710 [Verrucomicrobiales bacterium]
MFEDFDITQHLGLINGGGAANLLAINSSRHRHNRLRSARHPGTQSQRDRSGGSRQRIAGAQNFRYATNAAPNILSRHAPQIAEPAAGNDDHRAHPLIRRRRLRASQSWSSRPEPTSRRTCRIRSPATAFRITISRARKTPPTTTRRTDSGTLPDARRCRGEWESPETGSTRRSCREQAHRTLVRYRITVRTISARRNCVPYAEDPSLNFAYFCYDGVPDYGAHPAATSPDSRFTRSRLRRRVQQIAQGNGNFDRFFYNWSGTFVYDGIVYDNIRYRLRGANGRYHPSILTNSKRSMRFRFNKNTSRPATSAATRSRASGAR